MAPYRKRLSSITVSMRKRCRWCTRSSASMQPAAKFSTSSSVIPGSSVAARASIRTETATCASTSITFTSRSHRPARALVTTPPDRPETRSRSASMSCSRKKRTMKQSAFLLLVSVLFVQSVGAAPARKAVRTDTFCDSHFHLTNYIQEGITPRDFLKIMGDRVPRSTLFGIPLQQQWSYNNSGDDAPAYYLDTDAPLYYYSFTDAAIAMEYKKLSAQEKARFDPMITSLNPADMYAADHIRRVLKTFPGVFTGIGEFTIHKEFVSSKVAGGAATLNDRALDRVLDFAGEVGLVVILHSDVDRPMAAPGSEPVFLQQMKDVLKRHPKTTIIWAHTGVGRVVRPIENHIGMIESIVSDPAYNHVYFDISWDEVAKYVVSTRPS